MSENSLSRRKSAMLLFEIEESFGHFIKKNIDDIEEIPSSVLDTLQERKREIEVTTIDHVVERTYLAEIFQLASVATSDTSLNKLVAEISKLAVIYELYDIRNAIAHPNRTFPNCYWYRLAAFASDPLIAALGIQGIHHCLISAEKGIISDPPDEWLDNTFFEIRNNLPKFFEHDITGLIGREKENKKLITLLTNPRVNTVAVVAPGGYGKTALVLDMLQQQSLNPKTSDYADAILFLSLKTENLTIDGVNIQSAPQTISQVKEELSLVAEETYEVPFEDFEECKNYLKDQRLLICIDNLETLLRDNPETFDELNLEFPPGWRVIVTSRTMISSNQSITLEPLGKKHSANLIASYIKKKGGKLLGKEYSETIAKDCYFNPLAIRLTIDKIISGSTVHSAVSSTKNEIAEFSFRNLIESISNRANSILEALLLSGESEKIYLSSLLELNLDELSDALRELIPTSLLSRKVYDDVELFDLSSSIRDLLLLDTKNLQLRDRILSKKNLLERKASEVDKKQKELSISNLNVTYIPQNTHQSLKILIESFHRCRYSDGEKMSGILKEFKKSYDAYKNIPIFQREYARISSMLKDYPTAIKYAKLAFEKNESDPLNVFVLADTYFRSKDYKNSSQVYIKLLSICKDKSIEDKKFLGSVYHGLFQSLLWMGDYQHILDLTENWEGESSFNALFGGYRSTAFKRSVENSFNINVSVFVAGLTNSISVMDQVFVIAGYLKSPCIQSLKIIEEIEFSVQRLHTEKEWYKYCFQSLNFLNNHYKGIVEQQSLVRNSDLKIKKILTSIEILKSIHIKENPLKNVVFDKDERNINHEIDSSYLEVQVYHVMKDARRKFARDKDGVQYFLTKDNISYDLYSTWESISVGETLFIIPGEAIGPGKAIPVHDIIMD